MNIDSRPGMIGTSRPRTRRGFLRDLARLGTARALGLTLSRDFLDQVTEVIDS